MLDWRDHPAIAKQLEDRRAFEETAEGDFVEAPFVVARETPRAFGEIENDAVARAHELIAQAREAARSRERDEVAMEFEGDRIRLEALAREEENGFVYGKRLL